MVFLKISENSQEMCQSLFFNKVADLRATASEVTNSNKIDTPSGNYQVFCG